MNNTIHVLEMFGEPISNGGQESFVFNVIDHMDTGGLMIDAYTPYSVDNEKYKEMIQKKGGTIYCDQINFAPGKNRFNLFVPSLRFLKKKQYDVVHIHSGSISVLAVFSLSAKLAGVKKIIVHSHSAGEKKTLKYLITKSILTPILDLCPTDYCACSRIAAEWKYSKRKAENTIILNNGVDLQRFSYSEKKRQEVRKILDFNKNDIVLGHVGRFSYQKNQEFLVEILKQMIDQNHSAKLVFIGTGESYMKVKKMVTDYDLSDKVIFLGNVNNVEDYLQAFDVFVLPSFFEGLPIVAVESQATGLPTVVSSNVSKELQITDLVSFVSLGDKDKWIKLILEAKMIERKSMKTKLQEMGYDINKTSAIIREFCLH